VKPESTEHGVTNADDDDAVVPGPDSVTSAWRDHQDVIDLEGHPVDAVFAQSSL
jgi:hypothetical protein